jgi:CheY-like chemotaxis protein
MPVRHPSPGSDASILLVDDNAPGLRARKSVLEELGHHISTASTGADALEQFGGQKFDLVVTDFRMPRMDGLELIRGLRKLAPDVPIVLISGFVDSMGLNEDNTGADVVIQKSANEVAHLVRSVNRLLRRKPTRKAPSPESGPTKNKRKSS